MSGRSTGLLISKGRERRVPLRGKITHQNASACIARLVVLAVEGPQQPIVMYIDSPGGLVKESMSIISTMNGIKCPVATFCCGPVSGTAAIIAAHGSHGFRTAVAGCTFTFKVPDGSGRDADGVGRVQFYQMLAEVLALDTRKPSQVPLKWLTEGAVFDAQQALGNGLIDSISLKPILPKV